MKLLNFSVGRVQPVQIGTAQIRTAHLKAPVAEPWVITSDGPQADERAVHPDKVYAYARTGYDYWGHYLNNDPLLWPDGFFGENLTFDVLDEDELHIGDVLALGSEVRLVVAGPRNPCLKLSWRLGQPQTFQKIFQQSGRTGVYFDVLQPGRVQPGDLAVHIHRTPGMPSVVETARYAAGHVIPPIGPLKKLLDFPHLSKTLCHILHAKVAAAERAVSAVEGRWRGWRAFVIDRVVIEAPEIRSFYLRAQDGERLCQPRPGQFVTVRIPGADGHALTRCWSLSSHGQNLSQYRLTVRRQQGMGSNWLHQAAVGAEVWLRAPAGDFTLDMGGYRPVVLVAAGIGITPLLAMLHAQLARAAGIPIYLIYGARSPTEMAFRAELNALAAVNSNLHITYVYSRSPPEGQAAMRITPELLQSRLADNHVILDGRRIALPWYENDTYICGPGDFCAQLKSALVARGANPDHIFFELFSAPPTAVTELQVATVQFQRSAIECSWRADDDLTLLELAEQAGLELPSDCRAGACLTCRTRVITGAATTDLGGGDALLCVGRPRTALVVLDC